MSDQLWMEEAILLAEFAATQDEVPVGALVVYEDKIIARGFNQREQLNSPIAHAEILAIEQAAKHLGSWRLSRCKLISTLEPCLMCLSACVQARVENVIYGAVDKKGGALSLGYRMNEDERLNHRFGVQLLDTPKCGEMLKDFFKKKRKVR